MQNKVCGGEAVNCFVTVDLLSLNTALDTSGNIMELTVVVLLVVCNGSSRCASASHITSSRTAPEPQHVFIPQGAITTQMLAGPFRRVSSPALFLGMNTTCRPLRPSP